jgi:3-hydroxyacyl-CoA dehydrogenase/enoyl-CoA hydratase/3-hydroxybutyryl-CoA epimerase
MNIHRNNGSQQHWRLEVDAAGLAWATLDKSGESTNSLSSAVMDELAQLLDQFDRSPTEGLIFRSGKAAGFIAGADIQEFTQLDTPQKGHSNWWRVAGSSSTVWPPFRIRRWRWYAVTAWVAGSNWRWRVVTCWLVDEPSTRMGLPEVMLGIVPGWGGMLRLPERIGPQAALDMMLTGKTIDAVKAKRLGLADDCVPARVMDSAAALLVLANQPRRRPPLLQRLLNGPFKGSGGECCEEAGRQARAPRALSGTLRDHRHLGSITRGMRWPHRR